MTSFFRTKSLFLLSWRSLGKLWLVYSPIWWKVEGVLYPTRLHIDTAASNSRPGPLLSWSNKGTSLNWPGKSLSVHFPDQLSTKRGRKSASRWQCAEATWILKTVVLSKVRLGVLTLGDRDKWMLSASLWYTAWQWHECPNCLCFPLVKHPHIGAPPVSHRRYDDLAGFHAFPFYSWWIAAADGFLSLKIPVGRVWWIAPDCCGTHTPSYYPRHHFVQNVDNMLLTRQIHLWSFSPAIPQISRNICSNKVNPFQLCKHQ